MTKILIDEATVKLALEALKNTTPTGFNMERDKQFFAAITALREALAQQALDKKAENARELGLDYEPAQYSDIVSDGGLDPRNKFDEPAQQEPVAYPYLVNCTSCGEEKKVERGNHHPWCFCGSDSFDWGNSRDLPAQQDIQRLRALVRAQQITIDKLEAQQEPVYVYTCKGCQALFWENDLSCDCTVNGLFDFNRHILLDCTSPPAQQEPVYWQWRRKDQPWSLEYTFNSEVQVTTNDSERRALYTTPPAQRTWVGLTADDLKEPKNGEQWRVEWWNESCRMMLPADMKLAHSVVWKNGTVQFTIKESAHGIKEKNT